MTETKPILFCDFDGVLCHDRFWRTLKASDQEQIQKLLFSADKRLVEAWMRGQHSAEEISKIVSEKIDVPFEVVWSSFVDECKTMEVSARALDCLSQLRDRYVLVLITGNMDSFGRFTVPALRLDEYFDAISSSFDEGQFKTDNGGDLFLRYAQQFGVSIRDCLVLDDSAHVCGVFESLGGAAFRVTPEQDVLVHLKNLIDCPGPVGSAAPTPTAVSGGG